VALETNDLWREHTEVARQRCSFMFIFLQVCVIVCCWTLCVFLEERDAEIDGRLEEKSKETK